MNRLLIVGAGGLGREILGFAMHDPARGRDWDIGGFLDDRPNILDGKESPFGIVGSPSTYQPQKNDVFIVSVMDPKIRQKYAQRFIDLKCEFANVMDPKVTISFGSKIGRGNFFGFATAISCNVTIGNHVIVNSFANIGHDAVLEDFVSIHNRALISGGVHVGAFAEVGSNATVLPRSKMAAHSKLGAGSVLIGRAPSDRLMMGVPAKVMDV